MKKHLIPVNATIIEALEKLNLLSGEVMTLFAISDNGRLEGSLTDGDIRRALLKGTALSDSVTMAMNRNFHRFNPDDANQIPELRKKGVKLLPVVNTEGVVTELIDLTTTRARLPLNAILMAGGLGERLRPMTLTTPKPLLRIEGKAIIDYNIEMLSSVGVRDITVACRYLAEKLEDHFKNEIAGVKVRTVREINPMGTIGAVANINIPEEGNTIVMNSDILTSLRFEEMYMRHIAEGADITIAAIPYTVSVPYAILATENERVTSLVEKPSYSYFANAGIYIFRNSVLRTVEKDKRTDATTLIEQTIECGGKVIFFPINGTWIDIGTPADFNHAIEMMRHHKNFEQKQS